MELIIPEKGHYESSVSHDGALHHHYHIDTPEKRVPYTERRELAQQELEKIYKSTPYMAAWLHVYLLEFF